MEMESGHREETTITAVTIELKILFTRGSRQWYFSKHPGRYWGCSYYSVKGAVEQDWMSDTVDKLKRTEAGWSTRYWTGRVTAEGRAVLNTGDRGGHTHDWS